MKLKAIHLLHRLERLDRDLEELQQLSASIQSDRAYAKTLRESLLEESTRLRQLRSRILSQVIRYDTEKPDDSATPLSAPARTGTATPPPAKIKPPEIMIPASVKEKSAADTRQKKPNFRFVYDNKGPS